MSMKIELTPVEDSDNYFLFHLFDDYRSDNYRDMYFSASIEEAEEIANQLLQLVFESTEEKTPEEKSTEVYWHSPKTAAFATGLHSTTIQKYIRDGKIPAIKHKNNKYFKIDPYDLHKVLPINVEGIKLLREADWPVANWTGYSS